MDKPLAGLRVIEVAQWWFVPAAGAVLADWGADVIKIEHPTQGDPMRGLMTSGLMPAGMGVNFMWEQPNRGKRSVGIDIGTPRGLALLLKLVEKADVFLTSFLPEARARLGIDVDDVRRVNPSIVYARGHGQGSRGPDAKKGGYDAASFWCRGGIAHAITPGDAEQPTMQRAAFGDSMGGMTIAGGIAAALLKRARTGQGSVVDISLLATGMWVLAPDIIASKLFGIDLPGSNRAAPMNPIVNSYKTQDGRWIFLNMLQSDRNWPDLCRHLGHPELIDDTRFATARLRMENNTACVATLDAIFAGATLAEWRQKLDTCEGVWAPLQSAREIPDDPQVVANGYLPHVDRGENGFDLVANPVQFDETPIAVDGAPELGQHTEEVLLDAGVTWEELAADKESGAIS